MRKPTLLALAGAVLSTLVGGTSAYAAGEEGKDAFAACQPCHRIGEGAIHISGPHLNGLFGRKAGAEPGFHFSKAMTDAGAKGLVWNEETLSHFLEKPQAFVKGTRMPFRGVDDPDERKAIIAYVGTFSGMDGGAPDAAGPCAETVRAVGEVKPDKAYGEYLAAECLTCHQESGHADGIPAIVGLPKEVFVKAMCEYKTGARSHQVMNMMAANLGNDEMAALAEFIGSID